MRTPFFKLEEKKDEKKDEKSIAINYLIEEYIKVDKAFLDKHYPLIHQKIVDGIEAIGNKLQENHCSSSMLHSYSVHLLLPLQEALRLLTLSLFERQDPFVASINKLTHCVEEAVRQATCNDSGKKREIMSLCSLVLMAFDQKITEKRKEILINAHKKFTNESSSRNCLIM